MPPRQQGWSWPAWTIDFTTRPPKWWLSHSPGKDVEFTWELAQQLDEWLDDSAGFEGGGLGNPQLAGGNHLHGLGDLLDVSHTPHPLLHCTKE